MTPQETSELQYLFDRSVQHIRRQGEASIEASSTKQFTCIYRSSKGLGCAAAPFIVEYRDVMERRRWDRLIDYAYNLNEAIQPWMFDPLAVKHSQFVLSLQEAHDHSAFLHDTKDINPNFLRDYELQIQYVAARHKLVYTPPGETTP